MNLLDRLRNRLRGVRAPSADPSHYVYSYTVYWVKVAREWEPGWRRAVAEELRSLLTRADFVANPTERHYTLPGLEGHYSGASLVTLSRVLQALSHEGQGKEPSDD